LDETRVICEGATYTCGIDEKLWGNSGGDSTVFEAARPHSEFVIAKEFSRMGEKWGDG
jgi:hypothetical protein